MTRPAVWRPAISKEVRALLPLWAATVAAIGAALLWRANRFPDLGLLAYVSGSIAIGAHSIGHEHACRTLPILLSQPADRRRLYLIKFLVSAGLLISLAAFIWSLLSVESRQVQVSFVLLPVLCGLFLAPLATMIGQSSLAGTMVSATFGGLMWLATLAIAWFGFGIGMDDEASRDLILARWTLAAIVLSPLAGLLGWRRFATLEVTEVAAPALHLPRWLQSREATRRYSPWRALAAKEIHLQQLTFAVAGFYIVLWAAFFVIQRYVPSLSIVPLSAVMLLYCLGLALVIGALASAEERQLGTLDGQLLQPAPGWQQWMVKVGVTQTLALLLGVGLPIALSVAAGQGEFQRSAVVDLAVLVVLLTAGTLYISSLSASGVQAMAWSMPAGIGVILFIQVVTPMMLEAATASADPVAVVAFAARAASLVLTPLLLWFGFVNHRSSERAAWRVLQQAASVAAIIAAGAIAVGLAT